jgi:hypothetical protein
MSTYTWETTVQLLLCVKTHVLGAIKGKTYTLRDSEKCNCGKRKVSVEELHHTEKDPCFDIESGFPDEHFIPLNDPDHKEEPEQYSQGLPTKRPEEVTS